MGTLPYKMESHSAETALYVLRMALGTQDCKRSRHADDQEYYSQLKPAQKAFYLVTCPRSLDIQRKTIKGLVKE
jgi:hypothetical protein